MRHEDSLSMGEREEGVVNAVRVEATDGEQGCLQQCLHAMKSTRFLDLRTSVVDS